MNKQHYTCPACQLEQVIRRSKPPEVGSHTVCGACCEVLTATGGPELFRKMTADEWLELPVDVRSEIRKAQDLQQERAKDRKLPKDRLRIVTEYLSAKILSSIVSEAPDVESMMDVGLKSLDHVATMVKGKIDGGMAERVEFLTAMSFIALALRSPTDLEGMRKEVAMLLEERTSAAEAEGIKVTELGLEV